jgi:hypothetical protein
LTTSLSNYQPKGDYALKSDIQSLGKLAKKDIVEKKDLTEDV